jgi:hypothetical protein
MGSLSFNFSKKNGMSNFADKVNWNLDLKEGSKISGKDIRYFAKNWNSNSVINASSQAKGFLNNLTITNPILSVESTFYSASGLNLKNLVSPNSSQLFSITTKNARLQTSYTSLKSWLPRFISVKIPEVVSNFGTTNYNGDFSIDKNSIVTKGNMISSVGKVQADARLTEYSSKDPKYQGWVETSHLNLAPFIKSSALGSITSKIHFDGKGFSLERIDTKFDAQLTELIFEGNVINSITVTGDLKDKIFKGNIAANDEHALLDFEGNVDFSQKIIKTDFEADIQNLNLGYFIDIADKDTSFKGVLKTDIQFSSINDLTGQINISDITLKKEGRDTNYNDIQIKTTFEDGNRNLDVFSPNMITANIYGKYSLDDIPAMLQEGIGNLLVNYKPKKRFDDQEFSFILDLDVQKDLLDLLMLDINLSPGTTITGKYTGVSNQLQAQVISEYIYYKNIKLSNPNIFLNTADSLRQFMGSLSSLAVGDTKVENINFSGFKKNDTLFASTHFFYGKSKQTDFDMNLYQTRIGNDLIFGFKPSDINLVQAKWKLNPDFRADEDIAKYNVITNKLTLEKIALKSDKSEIMLSGEYISKDEYNFDLDLTEVELDKVLPPGLLKSMSFEGIANGSAKILKNSREFKPLVNIAIEGLKFNTQPLGDLTMEAVYDVEENKYLLDTKLIDAGEERFLAQGYIKNVPAQPAQLNIDLTANQLNIAPIGTFLQSVFSKFRGNATGGVQITGNLKNPEYQGGLTLSNTGFTVNFLGVDYQLTKDQELQILPGGFFFFDNIELKDTLNNTQGTVFGALMTKNFSEWGMDLLFSTDKLMVLNTHMEDNDLFFGTVYAAGNFSITGSTVGGIEISAIATALEGSNLTINSNSTTNATDISFIKFLPEKHEDDEESDAKPPIGLSIHADVTADNKSVVDLIISQKTGDKIEVRGDAKHLKFDMSKARVVTLDGLYTITGDSKYYYNIFVNKDFTIVPGSTIRWDNTNPANADLGIKATYTKLVSNLGDYLGLSTIPATNVTVTASLTGYLSKPSMVFDIDAEASTIIKEQLKSKLENNEGEKYNQVASIVVFGNFLSDKMGGSSYASSVYDVVLRQLTSVINNISGAFSLNTNFNAGSKMDNTSDRISIDPTLKLNQRLSIIGSVNMPLEQKSAADVWTYGAKIDYDISKNSDKSLILNGFSKPSAFGLETSLLSSSGANNQAYGGGIVYKRSFNSLSDLFGGKKKEEKEDKNKKTDSLSSTREEESN